MAKELLLYKINKKLTGHDNKISHHNLHSGQRKRNYHTNFYFK